MEWWQLGLLILVTTLCSGGLLLLRGRIAQVNGLAAAAVTQPGVDVASLAAELAVVRAEWKAHQKQLDAYLEAFEDIGDTVERKRRRQAARDSKNPPEGADPNPAQNGGDARAQYRARARSMGIRV